MLTVFSMLVSLKKKISLDRSKHMLQQVIPLTLYCNRFLSTCCFLCVCKNGPKFSIFEIFHIYEILWVLKRDHAIMVWPVKNIRSNNNFAYLTANEHGAISQD